MHIHLSRCLDLGKLLLLLKANLLPQTHDLEALEVVQASPLRALRSALRECGLLPFLADLGLLPLGLQWTGADTTGQLLDDDRGELHLSEASAVTGDFAGTLNKDTVHSSQPFCPL